MNDERAVEVIGQWLWDKGRTRTTEVQPHASEILAALRAEGYDLYRPDECLRGVVDGWRGTEDGLASWVFDIVGDPLWEQGAEFRLVPVGGEG